MQHAYGCNNFCSHGNLLFSSPLQPDFNILVILSAKNIEQGHEPNQCLYARWIIEMRHQWQMSIWNAKAEKPLILERSGTQYVAMGTKMLISYCEATLVETNLKESNISVTNWPRYLFIIFNQNSVS